MIDPAAPSAVAQTATGAEGRAETADPATGADWTPWVYVHDLDPVALSLGPFSVHWYGLGYPVGFLLGLWIMRALQQSDRAAPGVTPADVSDFLAWAVLSVVIGGRLGQVLFYDPAYFARNPLEIFYIWRGGMSFHGGLLGIGVATLWFSLKRRIPAISLMDLVALTGPPGIGLVRIANFVNGEHVGRPVGEGFPVAVIFPGGGPVLRHPSQLYEALLEGFLPFAVLLALALFTRTLQRPGMMLAFFLLLNGLGRLVTEPFRAEEIDVAARLGSWFSNLGLADPGLTWGQILTLPQVALGVGLLGWIAVRARKPLPAKRLGSRGGRPVGP